MRISVVIPAAGKGRRAGFSENKIFHLLPDGRTVIVLAQGSMYHLMPLLSHIQVPVLTSLETGVAQLRKYLDGRN